MQTKKTGRTGALPYMGVAWYSIGTPLIGASLTVKGTNRVVRTNEIGDFNIQNVEEGAFLVVSYLGYESREVRATSYMGSITLKQKLSSLQKVIVSTGYQTLSKERQVGSFATVNMERFGEQVTTNVLDRLPGIVSAVSLNTKNEAVGMTVRGLSTL